MDGKKRSHSLQHEDESNSSSDDSSVQRHVSGSISHPPNNLAESYYSSHINSVCAAMNTEAEKRMSPFEQLMLDKRRETNRKSASKCRKRRREEIKSMEEELRRLESETEELTTEKTRLQAELQQEVANSEQSGNQQRLSMPTQAPPFYQGLSFANLITLQQEQQFRQMMQLRQMVPMNIMPFNQVGSMFSSPFPAPSLGYDAAHASTLQQLAQAHGLDLAQTVNTRTAFSAMQQSSSQRADDLFTRLPLPQSNQQSNPLLNRSLSGDILDRIWDTNIHGPGNINNGQQSGSNDIARMPSAGGMFQRVSQESKSD